MKNEQINLSISKNTLKIIGICLGALILIVILVTLFGGKNNNNTTNNNGGIFNSKDNVKIVAAKNKSQEFETYKNNYVSIKIPKGWKVEEYTTYASYYAFHAYDPSNPDYQMFFNLKTDGFTKSASAKKIYERYQSTSTPANLPVLSPASTEHYFELFTDTSNAVYKINNGSSVYPKLDNFKMIDNLGKINVGGDIIRGTYKGTNGNAEGIFTATVTNPLAAQYVNGIDISYYYVYYTAFVTTPENELINWESLLLDCIGSIEFTDSFQTKFYNELKSQKQTADFNSKQSKEISDGIMDSWNKRQKSLDIQSQKRSDATLGYERVYDTETGEIYKAYNGFTDDYKGNRYKAISDSQYSDSIAGYIEK